jgi:hypothetical protein
MRRTSTAPTTKNTSHVRYCERQWSLSRPILAQLRIPFACSSSPMRLSGIQDNSTTKPTGPWTARSHLFGALATARATLLTLITSSAGRETRSRKPWTPPACWTLEGMASHSFRNCCSDERLFCQGFRRRANRWM